MSKPVRNSKNIKNMLKENILSSINQKLGEGCQ